MLSLWWNFLPGEDGLSIETEPWMQGHPTHKASDLLSSQGNEITISLSEINILCYLYLIQVDLCIIPLWRHQMETFSTLLPISPVPGEFPTQRPVTRSFDVYFDLCPNKRFCKQSLGWWFETLSPPLWRHRNANFLFSCLKAPNACHNFKIWK